MNKTMHLLFICQYFPPDLSGVSTRAYNAAKGLITQGCRITVVAGFPHYPLGEIPERYKKKFITIEETEGIKIIRTWIPPISHSSIARRIVLHASFIMSSLVGVFFVRKIDAIFSMNPTFFAFLPSLFYKFIFRKPIIRNVDDMWPEVFYDMGLVKSKLLRKILDFIASKSYHTPISLTPLSPSYTEILVKKYNVSREKITLIEHGVDTTLFCPSNIKKNNSVKTIMYSGALGYGYDFDTVIQAAKILEDKPIEFIIRGLGELEDYIKELIRKNKIHNIKLDSKKLEKKELIKVLNTADIFLLPMSKVKGFDYGLPTKVLEYQALGKPIVCISDGESKRYILETQSGLVTSSRDPHVLANLIMKLIDDEELAQQLGKNGLTFVQNNLTIEMIGKRFMDVLKKSLNVTYS